MLLMEKNNRNLRVLEVPRADWTKSLQIIFESSFQKHPGGKKNFRRKDTCLEATYVYWQAPR